MKMMYNDDKTWKQHYEDWKSIVSKMQEPTDGTTKQQYENRLKTIMSLIDNFDSN
jgi:hypothetical protein